MAEYDFYLTSKQIKSQTKDNIRGSWKLARQGALVLYLIFAVLVVTTVLLSIFVKWWISIPLGIVSYILLCILNYGWTKFTLELSREGTPKVSVLFCGFSKKIGAILAISIKRTLLSIFWLIMLIVPFFVKNIGYSMSTLMLIDDKQTNKANALKQSKKIMAKNYGRYFNLVMSFFGWFVLELLTAGLAFIWVGAYFSASKAVFYDNLKTDF